MAGVSKDQLAAKAKAYLATRTSTPIGFMVHDHRTGVKLDYQSFENETASTIKVLVLATSLRVAQENKTTLTAQQKALATQMITMSDNNATTALYRMFGRRPTLQRVADLFKLSGVTVHDAWGLTTVTPGDWVHLIDQIVLGSDVLTADNAAYIRSLMSKVIPSQRWGVANPPITGATTSLTKNGWGVLNNAWHLNSFGYIEGQGRKYTLAMLSRSPQGEMYGIETLNGLSKLVWTELQKPLTA